MAEQIEAPAQVSVAGQGRSGHRAKVYITLNKAHNGTKADLRTLLMSANGQGLGRELRPRKKICLELLPRPSQTKTSCA